MRCAAFRGRDAFPCAKGHSGRGIKGRDILYLALLITTVGFPTIAATFSWVNDMLGKK